MVEGEKLNEQESYTFDVINTWNKQSEQLEKIVWSQVKQIQNSTRNEVIDFKDKIIFYLGIYYSQNMEEPNLNFDDFLELSDSVTGGNSPFSRLKYDKEFKKTTFEQWEKFIGK